MRDKTKKLLTSLVSGKITKGEFVHQYTMGNNIDDEYWLSLLRKAFDNQDNETVEEAIVVGVTLDYFSDRFSEIFCRLLQVDWHYKHEDIARILQDLKDPSTVNCLFNAAQLHFEYLDYDDTYQFARKCIKALSAIDNEEAISKLRLLTQSDIPEIKHYAEKELKYKGLL